MIGEAGIITEAELALVGIGRGLITTIIIRDSLQLGPVSLASAEENPFHLNHNQSPFDRLSVASIPTHMLVECQGMVFG